MSGYATAAIAIAAVVGAGAAVSSANTQAGVAGQARSQSGTVFGEQQYYAQQLQNLIANPSSVTSLPGYQFNLDQGSKAVARQMAGSGFLGSGNEAVALTQYGQNYANSAYQTQAQLLGQFAGLTSPVNPTSSLGTASGATSAGAGSMNQLAAMLAFMGGSGGLGGGGSWAGTGAGSLGDTMSAGGGMMAGM